MNRILVGLVLIALLIGLGGGYGLGYVIYQPQLQNIHDELNNMGDEIDNLSNGLDNLHDRYDWVDVTLRNTQSTVTALNIWHDTVDSSLADAQSSLTALQVEVPGLWSQILTLRNQLNTLNSTLSNLDSTVEGIENRSWHEVYSLSASSNVTSGLFQLKGKEVRVMWTAISGSSNGWVVFFLYYSNGTGFGLWASSGSITANNAVLELEETGNYYLGITSYQADYYVSVWDYY